MGGDKSISEDYYYYYHKSCLAPVKDDYWDCGGKEWWMENVFKGEIGSWNY